MVEIVIYDNFISDSLHAMSGNGDVAELQITDFYRPGQTVG